MARRNCGVEAQARLEVIADTYLSVSAPVALATPAWLAHRHAIQSQILERVQANLRRLDELLTPGLPVSRLRVEGGWYAILRVPSTRTDEDWAAAVLTEAGRLRASWSLLRLSLRRVPGRESASGMRRICGRAGQGHCPHFRTELMALYGSTALGSKPRTRNQFSNSFVHVDKTGSSCARPRRANLVHRCEVRRGLRLAQGEEEGKAIFHADGRVVVGVEDEMWAAFSPSHASRWKPRPSPRNQGGFPTDSNTTLHPGKAPSM